MVVEHGLDGMLTVDVDGTVSSANPAAERMFGADAGSLLDRPAVELLRVAPTIGGGSGFVDAAGDPEPPLARTGLLDAIAVRLAGSTLPVELSVTHAPDGGGSVIVVCDITDRKRREHVLRHQASHDALTGLPNRMRLHESLTTALAEARASSEPVSVVMLDLDQFKDINDSLGHPVGDTLLRQVGRRLERVLRPGDTIARLGGDEFAVVLPTATVEDAVAMYVAKRGRAGVAVEALVRWIHPEHGVLPPDEFIGLAEHSGLIRPMTRWVIDRATRQCAAWRAAGRRLTVAVNLSARNLLEPDLPESIAELLDRNGLAPDGLQLEITEGLIMDDPERTHAVMTRLAGMGLRLAIDDYGTGYSPLAYLKSLPAAEIKIDKSFVLEMDRVRDDAVIVRSTIEMGHHLGLAVVAEGVESARIFDALRRLGCDFVQGYLFSKPLPAGDLVDWLDAHAAGLEAGSAAGGSVRTDHDRRSA